MAVEQEQSREQQLQQQEADALAFQHARCLAAAKAMLGQGQRSEAKQLLQAVVAQGLRALQQHKAKEAADSSRLLLPLQQLHAQALLLLGKAHGLAPSESDAAAHCFLLAARGPCPPLRPLALENLRVSFARLAALSGGGGAHRLASLHWDADRHRALVAAAVARLRSWQQQNQHHQSSVSSVASGTKPGRAVVVVTGPTAALLALLLARELQRGEEGKEKEDAAAAGVLVVEDSRVAATLGRAALDANGMRVGRSGSAVLGFVDSQTLLRRLAATKAGNGGLGESMEEGKGEGGEQKEEKEAEVVYAGLLFDPFPYTLPTLPLRLLAALRRHRNQRAAAAASSPSFLPEPFSVPDALRFHAQLVESPEMRTLNQVAPEDEGRVDGFQLGSILDALGRRAVPLDAGSFPYRPLAASAPISTLLPLASLLPLVDSQAAPAPAAEAAATASARTHECMWAVRVQEEAGRSVDAVLFWWDAGVLASSGDDDDDMRVLISCAPPPGMLSAAISSDAPLPLVPLGGMHKWQTAWLDFARFKVDPGVADGALQLQLRLEAPTAAATTAGSSPHMLPLSLHFLPPTPAAPPLVDAAQPERILDYHLPMVNDTDRNAAYAAWLRRALRARATEGRPVVRVLDIGAGSGLLGMMAARAGRELGLEVEVVCLEKVPVLAAAAGWAVEENGYGEQVTVVNELSSDVSAEDLGGRFDVLVSEILGDQPLSESVLPSFRHARSELLTPDALILPGRLTLWATVVRIEGLERVCSFPSSTVDGGDWGGWDCVLEQPLSLHLSAHEHTTLLDAPLRLGVIDLAQHPLPLSGTLEATAAIAGEGDANALVLWFEAGLRVEEDDGGEEEKEEERTITINTGPEHGQRPHWKQVCYPLAPDNALVKGLRAGERLSLRASYDKDRLQLQVVARE